MINAWHNFISWDACSAIASAFLAVAHPAVSSVAPASTSPCVAAVVMQYVMRTRRRSQGGGTVTCIRAVPDECRTSMLYLPEAPHVMIGVANQWKSSTKSWHKKKESVICHSYYALIGISGGCCDDHQLSGLIPSVCRLQPSLNIAQSDMSRAPPRATAKTCCIVLIDTRQNHMITTRQKNAWSTRDHTRETCPTTCIINTWHNTW